MLNEGMKSSGGDLVENGCFLKVKLANVCGFSDCLMKDGSIYILRFFHGAMLMKIFIVLKENLSHMDKFQYFTKFFNKTIL